MAVKRKLTHFLDPGHGWDVQIRTSYYENCFVRSLGGYKPYFVENPLQVGSQVIINRDELVTVVDINRYGYILESEWGARYQVPRSNPFRYVRPPADAATRISV